MIKFKRITPMLWSNQLKETIDFYTNVLGFTCNELNINCGWASVLRDEVEIMIANPNSHSTFNGPVFTGSFYINTEHVNDLWEEFKNKCSICYSITNFDYGMREFAIYDNNGYLLQFGQELTTLN